MTPEFLHYVVSRFLLEGALLAIEIAVVSMALGLVLGLGLALMRLSRHAALRGPAWFYIWFMRGTPLLLQLVFLYDALPAVGIKLDTFTTAVIGFALNEAAFSAEIIRGGILSVNRNQAIAAAALGMGRLLTLAPDHPAASDARHPAGHGQRGDQHGQGHLDRLGDLRQRVDFSRQQIVGQNFKFFTVFTAAAIIYLAMTSVHRWLQVAARAALQLRLDASASEEPSPDAVLLALGLPASPSAASPPPVPMRRREADAAATVDWLHADRRCRAAISPAPTRAFVVCRERPESPMATREVLKGIDLDGRAEARSWRSWGRAAPARARCCA